MGVALLSIGMKLALGLVIEGQTTCPSQAMVATALAPLLPEELGQEVHLRLTREDDWSSGAATSWLRVQLFDPAGRLLAERRLRGEGDCTLLARRVATVAAAWQAELSDEPLPAPPPPPAPPPADGPPAEALESEPPPSETRPAPPPSSIPEPTPSHVQMELGLGLSYTPNGGMTTALSFGSGYHWARFGVQGNLWGEGSRESGDRGASFARYGTEIGPTLRLIPGDPQVELRAQAVFAVLDAVTSSLDAGGELGGRVVIGAAAERAFLDARVMLWPRYFGPQSGPELSPVEVFFTVGIALGGS